MMREIQESTKMNGLAKLVVSLMGITTILSIIALYSPFPSFKFSRREEINLNEQASIPPQYVGYDHDAQNCDLFKGRWVRDPEGPRYTNASCPTIPMVKDCFLHGRNDRDFLYWRWKPDECALPRFEPKTFFRIVHGKKLAFIGDSLARNQMESLLCLITQEETPIDVYKDPKDRYRTWFFPRNNFTLMVLWTKFLVRAEEKEPRVVFNLHLDQVDERWAQNVSQGHVDFAIISDSQWYFKKNYLYEGGKLLGCIFCNETNVTTFGVEFAIGKAIQTALRYINGCEECKEMVTIVRTISPSHFENGTWKTGGICERTQPYTKEKAGELPLQVGSKNEEEWKVRSNQMEEIERVKREVGDEKREKRFQAIDITNIMLMRPDGHPGSYWRDKKKKGYNDCVHWCMPGPIDAWNDLLLALLSRVVDKSSLWSNSRGL